MMICLSIAPTSVEEARSIFRREGKKCDVIEVRIDGMRNPNLNKLLKKPRPNVIITNRRESDGGNFTGSKAEQFEILSQAIELGAEYIDVELSWGNSFVQEILKYKKQTKVIVSYHNFEEPPSNLHEIYQELNSTGADILKIAIMARDITDNAKVFNLLKKAQASKTNLIAFCMGRRGQVSRILAAKYGGFLTFASLDAQHSTATGQLPLADLIKTFRVHTLNTSTKVFGLVGNPVAHSKGIYFHNRIFQQNNIHAVYLNFLVDDLAAFFKTYREEISGLSITMPFKEAVITYVDSLEGEANRLGLVNTVVKRGDKFIGYNTDLPALKSILQTKARVKGKTVVIIGTGATAKTIAYAAKELGASVIVVGRSAEKANALAEMMDCEWAPLSSLSAIVADVLINATSVGTAGGEDAHLVPPNYLKRSMTVFDVVYNPPMTSLLQRAKRKGCKIISGLEMFHKQAQLQSKLFLDSLS
jgi:3-dehydroquinate dehydratase/shikimate dehydrogenase